jgi:hypothetical protein
MAPCRHVAFITEAYRRRAGGVAHGGRAFVVCSAAFLAAATVVLAVHVTSPIAQGWWLVAYLSLVGGVAQLLLGPGLIALSAGSGVHAPDRRELVAALVLWNAGTVGVAVSDLARVQAGVIAGSALLLAALWLFARGLRVTRAAAAQSARAWSVGYAALLLFLAASVVVGTLLARAPRG